MSAEITTSRFHDGTTLHGPTRLIIEDGLVVASERFSGDADHALVAPGLVDLQMNGFESIDLSNCSHEDFLALDRRLLGCGTTSWLATIVTVPLDRLARRIAELHEWITDNNTGCRGIHVEGPFLGRAPGAHNPEWIIDFDRTWLANLPSTVRLITLAPERPGSSAVIAELRSSGIVVSIGHSRATHAEFDDAVSAGAAMVTHLYNGMSGVHHRDEGVALATLTDDRVVAGLIADNVHVSPRAIRLAFATKTARQICLVSDSIAWNSDWARKAGVSIVDGAPRLPDGTLAGSSATLASCVRNVVALSGIDTCNALTSATSTPADLMGFPQTGRIRVGERAEILCLDSDLHVAEAHRGLVSLRGPETD